MTTNPMIKNTSAICSNLFRVFDPWLLRLMDEYEQMQLIKKHTLFKARYSSTWLGPKVSLGDFDKTYSGETHAEHRRRTGKDMVR